MDTNTTGREIPQADLAKEIAEPVEPTTSRDFGEQGVNGYDLSMFRENLRLTPTERIEKLNRALEIYFEVKRAGEKHRLSRRNSSSR